MNRLIVFGLAVLCFAGTATGAFAQKVSNVTKIEGEAFVVRCDPTSDWLAAWSMQPDGRYKLIVVNGDNGDRREISTKATKSGLWSYPGGISWIPNRDTLLFTYGVHNQVVDDYKVYYYTYDVNTKETTKAGTLTDRLQTYMFDPIPSEDGSKVFHMLIGVGDLPVFVTYLSESGLLTQREAVSQLDTPANISSEYDLSSDGNLVYWPLHDPGTGDYVIVAWDLEPHNWVYREAYTFGASADPAEGHAGIKVDTRHLQAAVLAGKENDPTLKMGIYNFEDTDNMYVLPIHLGATEEVQDFEWKGNANTLFLLIHNTATKMYSIEEIDPLLGARRTLHTSSEEISFVDYSVAKRTYYFAEVENPGSDRARTLIQRLR